MAAGFDNGDVKLWDLRKNAVRWEACVNNGVCGVEFDRKVRACAHAMAFTPRDDPLGRAAQPSAPAPSVGVAGGSLAEQRPLGGGGRRGDGAAGDATCRHVSPRVANATCRAQDIEMNKLVVSTLEHLVHVYDVRTQHPDDGFARPVVWPSFAPRPTPNNALAVCLTV